MFSRNIQIYLKKGDPDSMQMIRPADAMCSRLTRGTVEILALLPNNSTYRVEVFRGADLLPLWTDLVGNRVHQFQPGSLGIATIAEERGWTVATAAMFPDPNPVRADCLLLETPTTRDLWSRRDLEIFALRPAGRFLLQFRDRHAYVLTPRQGEYAAIRDEILQSNLDPGTKNAFTMHPEHRYPAGSLVKPYRFAAIEYKHRDVASEGGWDKVMDFRGQSMGPGISVSI